MTKKVKRLDTNQTVLDFDAKVEAYSRLKNELLQTPIKSSSVESYEEGCIEIAASVKKMKRDSGMSRENMVDAINKYFGWSVKDKRKCLTITTFNNWLSKPVEYPIQAIYIAAIQHICKSLETSRYLTELEGGKVATADEVRQLKLGKLDDLIYESRRLKKELRGKRI